MEETSIDLRVSRGTYTCFDHTRYNCGTWMDKMGESSKAGNRGIPATPRTGAPIEITGLLKSTLRWLTNLHRTSPALFPFEGVVQPDSTKLSYSDWDCLVQANFEAYYYIPENPDEDSKCIFLHFFTALHITELIPHRPCFKKFSASTRNL
jgi:glycogen debranching enzyme